MCLGALNSGILFANIDSANSIKLLPLNGCSRVTNSNTMQPVDLKVIEQCFSLSKES